MDSSMYTRAKSPLCPIKCTSGRICPSYLPSPDGQDMSQDCQMHSRLSNCINVSMSLFNSLVTRTHSFLSFPFSHRPLFFRLVADQMSSSSTANKLQRSSIHPNQPYANWIYPHHLPFTINHTHTCIAY